MRFISYLDASSFQPLASSALTTVPGRTRDLIHDSAAPSDLNTAGSELPLRSRTMITDWRLPD